MTLLSGLFSLLSYFYWFFYLFWGFGFWNNTKAPGTLVLSRLLTGMNKNTL